MLTGVTTRDQVERCRRTSSRPPSPTTPPGSPSIERLA
jgi:hypothetical protein